DFGIAKVGVDPSLTKTGATMGSIHYMAPEQFKGSSGADARSDLYSLGVTFYEAITGALPFQGETDYAVMAAHLNDAPAAPETRKASIPPELGQVIMKALAKDPAARFQSAKEFREAVQNISLPDEPTAPVAT